PPVSVHQCQQSVLISATCQYPSVAHHQCQSVPPNSASQCRLTVPVTAAYQCRLSVPYISAMYQCCLSVPISDACQCPPTSTSSSVPISATYQCPSVQP
ncbi:unnamed protein product, partial [Staurois parvus]